MQNFHETDSMALLTRKLMYVGMFSIALLVALTAGCSKLPYRHLAINCQHDVEEPNPLPPPETLTLSFLGASPPPSPDYVTQLDFELASFSGGSQPMMITDPKNPVSANYTVGDYTLQVTPVVGRIKQSNNGYGCLAKGCYKVDFFDKTGNPVAKFEVDENGYLCSKSKGGLPGYKTKGYISELQKLFVVSRKTTLETYPVFGVEFKQNITFTKSEFTDTDNYMYTFSFPDGKMMVYSAEAIGDLPEQLVARASSEKDQRDSLKAACKKQGSRGRGG